jgi:hypothetical protein
MGRPRKIEIKHQNRRRKWCQFFYKKGLDNALLNLWKSISQKRALEICTDRESGREEEVVQQEEVGTDCDDPSVMHNIISQTIDPTRDPPHVVDYGLQNEPRGKIICEFP